MQVLCLTAGSHARKLPVLSRIRPRTRGRGSQIDFLQRVRPIVLFEAIPRENCGPPASVRAQQLSRKSTLLTVPTLGLPTLQSLEDVFPQDLFSWRLAWRAFSCTGQNTFGLEVQGVQKLGAKFGHLAFSRPARRRLSACATARRPCRRAAASSRSAAMSRPRTMTSEPNRAAGSSGSSGNGGDPEFAATVVLRGCSRELATAATASAALPDSLRRQSKTSTNIWRWLAAL